jgi:hypothetical protein
MKELDQKIIELMDLFDDEQVTTADKIDRPQQALDREAYSDFMKRNPMAGGGMLVQPGFGGTRQGYREDKYVSPSNVLKNIDIPEKTKQKYVVLLKGINKWKKDPSAENWIEIFRKGDGLNQTQESLNVRRYITGKSYQGKKLFPQVKEHFEKMNLKQIIGPDVELIKDYTPEYFKKNRMWTANKASSVARLARSADEVREIAPFFKRAKDPKKLNVLNITKKLIKGYDSLNEYDQIAALENVSKRVSRYLEFLEDTREVGKLQKPQNAKEIISFIKSNMSDFEFGTSTIRNMKFAARDAALGLERGTTRNTRAILYDLKEPGKAIDEVAGLSATYKRLPGYTGLTQIIDADINQLKNTKIDIPFSSKYLDEILKGDFTNVANHNREARIFMRANPGVKIPLIVTGENLDPSKHIKYFNDLLPEEQKNIKAIAKKNKFVLKTDALPIKNLIATLSKDPRCSRGFKSQGGRAGFQEGSPPSLDVCYQGGVRNINSGMKNVTAAQAKNFAAFANRAASLGRGIMKYGIIPEALYVAADSLVRVGMGDSLNESLLRASEYLLPGNQTKKAEMLEADRFFGPEIAGIIGKSIDYKNQLTKIQSLEDQKANLENLSGGGAFDYVGDTSQDVKNIDVQLKQATDNLNNKFKMTDAERIYAERMQDETDDARSSGSFFTKLKSRFKDVDPDSDIETLGMPEKTQEQLNQKMLNQAPTIYKIENGKLIEKNLSEANTSEIVGHVKLLRSVGVKDSTKNLLKQRNYLRGMPLSEQEQIFGKEATYGASGTMGEPINKPVFKKTQNVIGDIEKEIVGQTNVANPFDLDLSMIGSGLRGFAAAGGGIAKEAGDRSGAMLTSMNPDSQGLSGLLKRGIKT